jgi:MFS family permease
MAIHILFLMCMLCHSGFGGSRVALSLYALDQGVSQFTIGVLMALYAICPLFLAIFVGRFADRVGPRIPMLIGVGGVVVGLLLPPLFPGVPALYACALILVLRSISSLLPSRALPVASAGRKCEHATSRLSEWAFRPRVSSDRCSRD